MIAHHDIERALLAVAVQSGGDGILGDLKPGMFDSQQNRLIFGTLQHLWLAGKPLDEPTVTSELSNRDQLRDAGGKAGVSSLYFHDTALRSNAKSYIEDLTTALRRRELAATLTRLAQNVETDDKPLHQLIETVEQGVLEHTRRAATASSYVDAPTMVTDALALIDAARERGDGLVGYNTGLHDLNQLIGGWEDGTFTILMGPPGVGKTALWLQSAMHVAKTIPIAVVQLEMTPAKMGMRVLSNEARVSFRRLRRGAELHERDWTRLSDMLGQVAERQVHIAPKGVHEWLDIRSWFRRMHLDYGAKMLFLDNIKIVGMPNVKALERFNTLTRELKVLSHELNVPIVAIHHLHRLEEGARPTLTSGYGSSSIEQDADNVIALWKPDPDVDDEVEVLPLKTRDDAGRPFSLQWIGDQQRYSSLVPTDDAPAVPYSE